jgi:recombination associated protein RdgC
MFFKNIRAYQLRADCSKLDIEALDEALNEKAFEPCHKTQPLSYGWIPPLPLDPDDWMVYDRENCAVMCLKIENKVLPPKAINEAVAKKVAELEEKQHRKLTRKERQGVKEEIIIDQLPVALTTSKKIYCYLDRKAGMFYVDCTSEKDASTVIGQLRKTIGSFPCVPLNAREVFKTITGTWIENEKPTNQKMSFTGDFEFQSLTEKGSKVKFIQHDDFEEAKMLLASGFGAAKVALSYNDQVTFTIDELLCIKKVKYHDLAEVELAGEDEIEDAAAKFQADFLIQKHFFDALFADIIETFNQVKPDVKAEEQLEIAGL